MGNPVEDKKFEIGSGLLQKVMSRIKLEQSLLSLKRKLGVFTLMFLLSLPVLVLVSKSTFQELGSSGWSAYLSLAFFDIKSLGAYWQDLAWSLLESLPAFSLTVFLSAVFLSSFLFGAVTRYLKNISQLKHS